MDEPPCAENVIKGWHCRVLHVQPGDLVNVIARLISIDMKKEKQASKLLDTRGSQLATSYSSYHGHGF